MKFHWFRKKKMNKRKEGASLVSVIIGSIFLTTIGLTITTVATRYAVSVYTERNSSDNFYEAEGILAEVRTGLIERASEAGKESYEEILQDYLNMGADAKMEFSKKYIKGLAGKLRDNDAVEITLDGTTKTYTEANGISAQKLKEFTRVPDAVKPSYTTTKAGVEVGYYNFDIVYDNKKGYKLIVRDLDIDYTNEADYRSQVTTDLVFATPDYKFDGDSTFDALKDYLVITDSKLSRCGGVKGGTTSLTGNIYTGRDVSSKPKSSETANTGIEIEDGMTVNFNAEKIISRGSFDIHQSSKVTASGEAGAGDLWLDNIRVRKLAGWEKSTLPTTLKIHDNTYVSNDLDIEANYADVYLAGTYYGYSFSENNQPGDEGKDAKYSSAILVNGLSTGLFTDWKNPAGGDGGGTGSENPTLDKLVLAGHTFVERDTTKPGNTGAGDIVMGESVAAKSDQIAYMVPDDYLTGVNHNPVMPGDYKNGKNIFLQNVKNALNNSPLREYLNADQPYIENHTSIASVDAMYLFLNFKSIAAANRYFYDYFSGSIQDPTADEGDSDASNSELLNERAQTYLRATDIDADFSSNLYLLAGYMINKYNSAEDTPNYLTAEGDASKPKPALLEDGRKMMNTYLAYCTSLTTSYVDDGTAKRVKEEGTSTDTPKLVSEKILTINNLDPGKVGAGTASLKVLASNVNCRTSDLMVVDTTDTTQTGVNGLIVTKGDVIIDAPFRGLIIAGGKVTVNTTENAKAPAAFEGLIIAQKKVEVTRDAVMKANIVMINEILEYVKHDEGLAEIFNALNGTVSEDETALEKCITYQNWRKEAGAVGTETE